MVLKKNTNQNMVLHRELRATHLHLHLSLVERTTGLCNEVARCAVCAHLECACIWTPTRPRCQTFSEADRCKWPAIAITDATSEGGREANPFLSLRLAPLLFLVATAQNDPPRRTSVRSAGPPPASIYQCQGSSRILSLLLAGHKSNK